MTPLKSQFTGKASLRTSNSLAQGPFTESINMPILFSDEQTVQITDFPQITMSVPGTGDQVTLSKKSGGTGTYAKAGGSVTLPITIHLHNSSFFLGDSDINYGLTTGASVSPGGTFNLTGSPLDATGNVTLVGASVFQGGVLDGSESSLEISGVITPLP